MTAEVIHARCSHRREPWEVCALCWTRLINLAQAHKEDAKTLREALRGLFGDGSANAHLDSECGPNCEKWQAARKALGEGVER